MDPLSSTANVAGIVSLGLTVTDALIKYCKKYRSQDADLAQMRYHAEQLESFISIISTRISGSQVAGVDINNSFQGCQNACSSCLRDFKALYAKYAHPKPSQKFIFKLKYPFDKDEFDNLRSRLQDFHVKLLAHLQVIHLDATREIRGVITSENAKVSLTIESVGRQLQSSISSSQDATITTISNGLGHRIQCLSDQFKEGQRVQTSDIIDHIDQRFREFESWAQTRNIGWNDQKGFTKPTTTLCNRDQGVSGITSSVIPVEDLLSSLCQCPRNQRRISSMHHERGCIFSFNNRKKRSITARFQTFQRQVTATWELEYSRLAWSRNWRINRNITIRAIVPSNSPAFNVLHRMYLEINAADTARDLKMALKTCLIELEKVFRNGLAWPTDARKGGTNLLHYAIFLLDDIRDIHARFPEESVVLELQFIQALIQMGVPTIDSGEIRTVLDFYILISAYKADSFKSRKYMMDHLIGHGADLKIYHETTIIGILSCSTIAELSEQLSPTEFLSQILRRSEKDIFRLLRANKSVLCERTKYGQTPIHLASNWLRGLEILIELGGETIQSIINIRDKFGYSALDYATWLANVDSIQILVSAGASIRSDIFRILKFMSRNPEIESVIAQSLAQQRRELSRLAFLNLPSKIIESLNLKEGSPVDSQAFGVIENLRRQGVLLPAFYDYLTPTSGPVYTWPYMTASIAQNLYDAGFHNPDTINCGYSPLMLIVDSCFGIADFFTLLEWFQEHGLSIHEPIPVANCASELKTGGSRPLYRTIHLLGSTMKSRLVKYHSSDNARYFRPQRKQLHQMKELLEDKATDPCLCYCTSNGCTFASKLFRNLSWWDLDLPLPTLRTITPAVSGGEGYRIALDLIRVLAFHMLGMKHTCCHVYGWSNLESAMKKGLIRLEEPEEIAEIRDEDRFLAELLESLMEDFGAKFREMKVPLDQFMEGYFWTRMKQVKKQKDEFSVEEIIKMRDIGVVLDEL